MMGAPMLAENRVTKAQEPQAHAPARAKDSNGLFKHVGVPLHVEALVKHYMTGGERVVALNGVTLDVQPGRPVGLVGVSGCGKSTLLNLVGGVDRPDSGSVTVHGVNVTRLGEREVEEYRLSKVGFVFQSYNLIPSLSAAENLQLPMVMLGDLSRSARSERARQLLALLGLSHKAGKRPDELSGGEKQRQVAIGWRSATTHDRPGREPTANLDHRNLETVFKPADRPRAHLSQDRDSRHARPTRLVASRSRRENGRGSGDSNRPQRPRPDGACSGRRRALRSANMMSRASAI